MGEGWNLCVCISHLQWWAGLSGITGNGMAQSALRAPRRMEAPIPASDIDRMTDSSQIPMNRRESVEYASPPPADSHRMASQENGQITVTKSGGSLCCRGPGDRDHWGSPGHLGMVIRNVSQEPRV